MQAASPEAPRALETLILEDVADDRFLVERALRRSGLRFNATWVESRRAFEEAIAARRPDVILTDGHLPDIDAAQALRIAADLCPGIPVIVVSGHLGVEHAARLLGAGASDYVLKDRLARLGPAVTGAVAAAAANARRCADALRLKEALLGTIEAITRTVDKRDPYTAGHQNRVADIAVAIGREMGLEPERIEGLRLGALIHDIGKISVPSEILNRPGKLTAAEFALVKAHPETGYDIVKDVAFPWPVAQMILQHHERLDGSGYPQGLKGEAILLEARIVAVADVLESMSAHRPYRAALGLEAALLEITSKRGTAFDARVVDACVRVARA